MDGEQLQAILAKGFAAGAQAVGLDHTQFRPTGPTAPLSITTRIGTLRASFSPKSGPWFNYGAPTRWDDSFRHALLDPTDVEVGDYFQHATGTYFIASLDPIMPPMAIACNTVLELRKFTQQSGVGLGTYGGGNVASEVVLASGWPASVLMGKISKGPSLLPTSSSGTKRNIRIPDIPGIDVSATGVLVDSNGIRYVWQAGEKLPIGWHIVAELADVL